MKKRNIFKTITSLCLATAMICTNIITDVKANTPVYGWHEENGNKYWYENGVRQGLEGRGKEIYDPDSDAWYWLDSVDNGKMAVNKDVYQESFAGIYADRPDGTGKWVRYDENGHMIKGWDVQNGNTYYFDMITGAMVKGNVEIDGNSYFFDTVTGVLKSGNPTAPNNGWYEENGNKYWYENGVRQGLEGRGKEIYDPDSDAWYWLDSVDNGKMAVNKDVYQESYAGIYADQPDGTGKWVRYDESGHMVKGWNVQEDNTYYFDLITGAMVKGKVEIDGKDYFFDTITGILQNSAASDDTNNSDEDTSDTNEDVPHVHSYIENITKAATCTQKGEKTFTCTCGDYYIEEIPAAGHNAGDWQVSKEASCTEDGFKIKKCTICGENVDSSVITKLGHTWSDWTTVSESTENETGLEKRICSVCKTEETRIIPKKEHVHNYTETSRTESTCTAAGAVVYTCSCGDFYTETLSLASHNEGDWEVVSDATCTSHGSKVKKCTACGAILKTELIEKTAHVYSVTEEKAATCLEDGYTRYKCNSCDSTYDKIIPALGHHYVVAERTEPTCTTEGKIVYTCDRAGCGDSYEESVAMLEHKYNLQTIAPTCEEDGYTIKTCELCGDEIIEINEGSALSETGHDEGEWITTVEPALGVDGKKERHCTRCNALLEEGTVDMLLKDGVDSVYEVDSPSGKAIVIGHYGTQAEVEKMYELTNNYRVENGCTSLTYSTLLETCNRGALERAVTSANYWEHWHNRFSENFAYTPAFYSNYDDMEMVQEVFDAWIASEGHKNNILSECLGHNVTAISVFYKRVEVIKGHYLYERYWVQIFD